MTWKEFYETRGPLFERYEEPHESGRRLEVGGFVLADDFEHLLRHVSIDYLRSIRDDLDAVLAEKRIVVSDLAWGSMHPGVTELTQGHAWFPSNFTGWTSRQLAPHSFSDAWCQELDALLRQMEPPLMMAFTWRSSRWNIPNGESAAVEALIEYLWTEECTDWVPWQAANSTTVPRQRGLWVEITEAIRDGKRRVVERLIDLAPRSYSELGSRVVQLACQQIIDRGWLDGGGPGQTAA